jgi:formate hydrogenlyase subunit 3/multisubunit Na+/H+ antiporter MnhD subunit
MDNKVDIKKLESELVANNERAKTSLIWGLVLGLIITLILFLCYYGYEKWTKTDGEELHMDKTKYIVSGVLAAVGLAIGVLGVWKWRGEVVEKDKDGHWPGKYFPVPSEFNPVKEQKCE